MKQALHGLVAVALTAGAALAAETTPSDVVYDEYGAVEASLTGAPGDPVEGRKVFANRKLGNCLACHMNSELEEQPFHGEVGPPLDGVADRWEEAELRGIVANAKKMFEGTIMPAFHVTEGYNRPLDQFAGKPILTAEQVEDVVAYLMTLKEE
jgi:sulfur-oxidizing protein SoxX